MTVKEFRIQYALGSLSLDMKRILAMTTTTPKKILTMLATDKDWWVRHWVSGNPNTSVSTSSTIWKYHTGITHT